MLPIFVSVFHVHQIDGYEKLCNHILSIFCHCIPLPTLILPICLDLFLSYHEIDNKLYEIRY
jgi:hypothetical protein